MESYKNISIDIENISVYGTCLAKNLLRWLNLENRNEKISPYGTLFNPFSINFEISRLLGDSNFTYFVDNSKTFYDQCRTWTGFQSLDDLKSFNQVFDKQAKRYLLESSAIFISYGVIETWVNKNHPQTIYNKIPIDFNEIDRTIWMAHLPSKELLIKTICNTIDMIQKMVGWSIPIIFAVCPVSIKFTMLKVAKEQINRITKDTLTESIKVAISQKSNCLYFEAYEIFNKLKEQDTVVQLDGRHLLPKTLEQIYNAFMLFCNGTPKVNHNNFWVPYYNQYGKIIGKIFNDNRIELG